MSRKRGKLSNEEMAYIRQNCFDLSLEEMANHLNRTIEPVRKFIDKSNLKARGLTDDEHLLATLRSKAYYKRLARQFSDAELMYLEDQWITYFKQFAEDVVHSEEMQIVELIRTEILIDRSMEDRRSLMNRVEELEAAIAEEREKPHEERDTQYLGMLTTQLGAAMGSKGSYINEHEKLVSKKERYLKDIKGTRDQRKSFADNAKLNFPSWLRQISDEDERKKQGYEMEVHAAAADKARERLAQYHTYEDGEVDQPLLNHETFIEEED